MANASGSNHDTYYIEETVYGETPATPQWTLLPHTGNTLQLSKEAVESSTLRGNRQRSDPRHGNESITGNLNVEIAWNIYDDFLEAAMMGEWTVDVLKVGTIRRSFSILRHFKDIDEYLVFTGVEISSVSFTIQPNSLVTANFAMLGQGMSDGLTSGSTFAAETDHIPMSSWDGSVEEDGSPIAIITSIEPSVENNMNALFVVGQKQTLRPDVGMSTTTGTISAYFQDLALLNKYRNETVSSLSFETVDPAGNMYTFLAPRVKYMSASTDVSGEGALTVPLNYTMMYDSTTTETNLQITRLAA